MAIIRSLKVKPINAYEILPTEGDLKYAVVENGKIIAVFGDDYWAERFVTNCGNARNFTIREVVD